MVVHRLTGNQRNRPHTNWYGKVNFVLEVEVEISGETIEDSLDNFIPRQLPTRLEWRDATVTDFCLPGNAELNLMPSIQGGAVPKGFTALPDELIRFLMGCGELDGLTFGDKKMEDNLHQSLKPMMSHFWWRREIRKHITDLSILDAEEKYGDDPK